MSNNIDPKIEEIREEWLRVEGEYLQNPETRDPLDQAHPWIGYFLSEYDRLQEGHDVALKALEKAEKFITTMMEFYGEGLIVHNWHQNGDGEPWDNFFDNNMKGDELESIRTALSHLKG